MDVDQVQQDILQARAQLDINETGSTVSSNPLSHFRLRIVPDLKKNHFDRFSLDVSQSDQEFDEIIRCAVLSRDWKLFQETLWLIKDETNEEKRRSLVLKYIRIFCLLTDENLNDSVDQTLNYLHQDIETNWSFNIGFLIELLHHAGVNVEKFLSICDEIKISNVFLGVELQWKLNNEDSTTSSLSSNEIVESIRRVFRVVLSLCFFQVEKLKSSLTDDEQLFLFLLGFYLQLDKRFQDMNTIHLARRLMVNSLTLLNNNFWNERRDLLVECLYTLSSKNVYITELFLKTNERTVRLRTQLALLHLKRLLNLIEHEKKSESSLLDEIIQTKLDPRQFERQVDFIDSVRLLADIIDSYPYDQQIIYLTKLYEKVLPYVTKTHEKLLTDEQHLILFDDCERWETMLRPVLSETDYQKLVQRK